MLDSSVGASDFCSLVSPSSSPAFSPWKLVGLPLRLPVLLGLFSELWPSTVLESGPEEISTGREGALCGAQNRQPVTPGSRQGLWGPLVALMELGTGSVGFQPGQIN